MDAAKYDPSQAEDARAVALRALSGRNIVVRSVQGSSFEGKLFELSANMAKHSGRPAGFYVADMFVPLDYVRAIPGNSILVDNEYLGAVEMANELGVRG
jgi:hypothetical protein